MAEDDSHLAFLDINPVAIGHVLVIPKRETDYVFDLEENEYKSLFLFAKRVAFGLKRAIPCLKVGVSIIGLEVPHAHIHLVPMRTMSDINFSKSKLSPTKEELEQVSEAIKMALADK